MNIGVRAHDFGNTNIEELAKIISSTKAKSIQLALAKALPDLNTGLGSLSPGLAVYIRDTLKKYDINISVLGCYINLIHPEPDKRKSLLDRFKEHIRYARDFGCSIVGTETGSLNADYSYNSENSGDKALGMIVESVSQLVEEAEKFGVFVAIEGVTKHSICSPERMKYVLDTINSNNLQVIFDPVNFLDENNYENQDEIIKKSFDLFGDKIAIIHSKDFVIKNGKMSTVPTGKGNLNYDLLIKLLKEQKPYIDVLLENSSNDTVVDCFSFLEKTYKEV